MPLTSKQSSVQKAIQAIRGYYAVGQKSLDEHPGRMAHGGMDAEAAEYGLNPETLRKARVFADPTDGYTPKQLDRLCELCKKHDFAMGVSFIPLLLSVPKKDRAAMQRQLIKEGWSRARLNREIKARFGKRRDAGRKPTPVNDVTDAFVRLSQFCGQWHSLCDALREEPADGVEAVWAELPRAVQRAIGSVDEAMGSVEKRVAKAMVARRKTAESKPGF